MLVEPISRELMRADHDLSSVQQPPLFLDRDGVNNVNHGYVHRQDNFQFIDGIFEVANDAHAIGYKLVVFTN